MLFGHYIIFYHVRLYFNILHMSFACLNTILTPRQPPPAGVLHISLFLFFHRHILRLFVLHFFERPFQHFRQGQAKLPGIFEDA